MPRTQAFLWLKLTIKFWGFLYLSVERLKTSVFFSLCLRIRYFKEFVAIRWTTWVMKILSTDSSIPRAPLNLWGAVRRRQQRESRLRHRQCSMCCRRAMDKTHRNWTRMFFFSIWWPSRTAGRTTHAHALLLYRTCPHCLNAFFISFPPTGSCVGASFAGLDPRQKGNVIHFGRPPPHPPPLDPASFNRIFH